MLFNKQTTGFTLVELTVTVSLVVIMLSVSSILYRQSNKRTELTLTTHNIASTLRLAESYAASAKELNNDPKQNAWGVYFDLAAPERAIMFNDVDNNGLYTGEAENYRVLAFGRQIKISKLLNKDRESLSEGKLTVLFLPPDPKVKLCPLNTVCATGSYLPEAYVILKDDVNESVKEVSINSFGLIDVR